MTTMQERAAKVAEEHARSYGAIDNSRTTDQRSRDYACEKALLTVAETIRALSPDPTRAALEAIANDLPARGPNGFEDYSTAYSRLKQIAARALQGE